ncbi:MAG: PEP-CTERM sorting domain-containing protein [Myxococcota bacterium]
MHRVIVGMVAALILLGALPTRALLIDFEEFGVPAGGNVEGQNRVSKGFLLESSHNHLINNQPGVTAWNDSTWLGNVGKLTLSNTDGSLFSLLSLQAAEFSSVFYPTPQGTQISVIGYQPGGVTLTQLISLDDVADGSGPAVDFQSVVFGPGWTDLESVVFDPVGTTAVFFALDDLALVVIPEPSTSLLMLGGLGVLSGVARRQRGLVGRATEAD